MYQLIFHPASLKEFRQATIWYETQQETLGDRFAKVIYNVLDRIRNKPDHFGFGKRPFREATVPIFPYTIVYKIDKANGIVRIASIYHTSRNPRFKFRRV